MEATLKDRGAIFENAGIWQEHVAVDQRAVTGQNPQSAHAVGNAVLLKLQQVKKQAVAQ